MKKMIAFECLREYLKDMRVQNQLTQAQLAEKLHVCPQTISAYERGVINPNYEMILHYIKLFEELDRKVQKEKDAGRYLQNIKNTHFLLERLRSELSYDTKIRLLEFVQRMLDINED